MVFLPFTSGQALVRGAAVALSLALVCACGPRLVSAPSPSTSLEQIRDDPAHDAQSSLLREAHRAFAQERYSTAVLFFRRYVDSAAPGTPQLAEARWWLGRSYEQMGEYRTAMAEYRALATMDVGGDAQAPLFQHHALQRLDQLRRIPGGAPVTAVRQIALGLPLSQLPPVSGWVAWLQALLKTGVTTVLLDPADTDRGTERSPESIQAFIGAAHLAGLSVWGALDPHQGQSLSLRAEWLSRSVLPKADRLPRLPDPLVPDYQAAIEERAAALLRAGCDGILLKARASQGYAQDFSDASFQRFTSAFSLAMTPQQLFGESAGSEAMVYDRESTYWRWVGWKARGYATLAARVRQVIRTVNPAGRLVIEVHGRTAREPLFGLEHYGEDLNDFVQRSGGELLIREEDARSSALVESVARQAGLSDRLWLIRTVTIQHLESLVEWTEGLASVTREQGEGNLLVLPRAVANLP